MSKLLSDSYLVFMNDSNFIYLGVPYQSHQIHYRKVKINN